MERIKEINWRKAVGIFCLFIGFLGNYSSTQMSNTNAIRLQEPAMLPLTIGAFWLFGSFGVYLINMIGNKKIWIMDVLAILGTTGMLFLVFNASIFDVNFWFRQFEIYPSILLIIFYLWNLAWWVVPIFDLAYIVEEARIDKGGKKRK